MSPSPVPSSVLNASIHHVYQVFERYPLRRHIEGCPCGCLPPDAQALLHAAPLRELTAQHRIRFALKTMTTWGDEVDFKHFLPRLLELMAQDQLSEVQILLGKLMYGQWRSWPDQEHAAIKAFLQAWWDDVLKREPLEDRWGPSEVATVLEGIAQAEHDLTSYLTRWDELDTPSAVRHLAAFVLSEAEGLIQAQLQGAYWTDRAAQAQQVVHWFLKGRRQTRLEAAAHEQGDATLREIFEMASYTLSIARGATN